MSEIAVRKVVTTKGAAKLLGCCRQTFIYKYQSVLTALPKEGKRKVFDYEEVLVLQKQNKKYNIVDV